MGHRTLHDVTVEEAAEAFKRIQSEAQPTAIRSLGHLDDVILVRDFFDKMKLELEDLRKRDTQRPCGECGLPWDEHTDFEGYRISTLYCHEGTEHVFKEPEGLMVYGRHDVRRKCEGCKQPWVKHYPIYDDGPDWNDNMACDPGFGKERFKEPQYGADE